MKNIKFAIQTAVLMLAFPVYFYAEVNHGTKKSQAKLADCRRVVIVKSYTKNGPDKPQKVTPVSASIYTNTIFINSFN